jgi:hypothetical protein
MKANPRSGVMECTNVRDELIEVLYGEAAPDAARRVEEHCAGCAVCREELNGLRRLRQDLPAWKVPETRRTLFRRPAVMSRWLPAAVAAALLLSLGGVVGLTLAESRFRRLLDEREARHQQEITELKASVAVPVSSVSSEGDDAMFVKVQDLIRQSELRQAAALNASLSDLSERTDAQRRYDLARVSAGLSYLDGKTGQNVARTTELMGYVLQASQKK